MIIIYILGGTILLQWIAMFSIMHEWTRTLDTLIAVSEAFKKTLQLTETLLTKQIWEKPISEEEGTLAKESQPSSSAE